MEEHPLQNVWTAWEHRKATAAGDYGLNMSKICTFDTVEGFWRFMNFTPPPSEMFATEGGGSAPKFTKDVEGISVFKKDVRPEWEDPKNMSGGEFQLRKTLSANQLDQFWEDLLLATVGETVDPTDVITGVRIVDKTAKGKVIYRLEVWFECSQDSDPQTVDIIRENLMQMYGPNLKFEYKPHAASVGHEGGHGGGGGGGGGRFYGGGRRG